MARKELQEPAEDKNPTSGPVDPNDPDAAFMTGHPAKDDSKTGEQPPVTPQLREVTINGRKFAIDPELADTLSQRDRDIDRKMNERNIELGNLRKFYQEHQKPPDKPVDSGYATLLFEDPNGAVNRIKDEIRQEYIREKRLENFWNSFYRKNKDIDRDEDSLIVEAVAFRHRDQWASLDEVDAAEKLAELSRKEILKYQKRAQLESDDEEVVTPRTRVESASRPTAPRRQPQPGDDLPNTLTEKLKADAARRRNAMKAVK